MTQPVPLQRSFWQRRWMWLVGLGCLSLIIVVVGFTVAIAWTVIASVRSSDAYKEALRRAATDCEVQAQLGTPLEPGWFTSGTIDANGSTGNAELSIPLKGSAHKGTLYAIATKSTGQWVFVRLDVEVTGQSQPINLIDPDRKKCPDALAN